MHSIDCCMNVDAFIKQSDAGCSFGQLSQTREQAVSKVFLKPSREANKVRCYAWLLAASKTRGKPLWLIFTVGNANRAISAARPRLEWDLATSMPAGCVVWSIRTHGGCFVSIAMSSLPRSMRPAYGALSLLELPVQELALSPHMKYRDHRQHAQSDRPDQRR